LKLELEIQKEKYENYMKQLHEIIYSQRYKLKEIASEKEYFSKSKNGSDLPTMSAKNCLIRSSTDLIWKHKLDQIAIENRKLTKMMELKPSTVNAEVQTDVVLDDYPRRVFFQIDRAIQDTVDNIKELILSLEPQLKKRIVEKGIDEKDRLCFIIVSLNEFLVHAREIGQSIESLQKRKKSLEDNLDTLKLTYHSVDEKYNWMNDKVNIRRNELGDLERQCKERQIILEEVCRRFDQLRKYDEMQKNK
jgi:hypothetical protein